MAPRQSDENQRIRDERREKIMAAATELFAHRGLAATKISDIAHAANMSLGLIYHYFENKEQLFTVLVEGAIKGLGELYQGVLEQEASPLDKIQKLSELMIKGLTHGPQLYMVVLQAVTSEAAPAELRQLVIESSNENARMLVELVKEGQAAGQFVAGNPEELVELYYLCIQGYAIDRAFFGNLERRQLKVDNLLRILKAS